ncbi:hypothetical protein GJ744_004575 [Endocarpon pusillum]|uniref:Helicase C-terminal domain-containing protein n=1 Tax=Endocarpon pusillum TaxID=364733 RepID=A0A8H7AQV7_9EURO|nr:hypothetical protein GJ744_004575 [Endocarpon pusillum]
MPRPQSTLSSSNNCVHPCQGCHARVDAARREEIFDDFTAGRLTTLITPGACAFGVYVRRLRRVVIAEPPDTVGGLIQRLSRSSGLSKSVRLVILLENGNHRHFELLKRFKEAIETCKSEPEPRHPQMPRPAAHRFKLRYETRMLRFTKPGSVDPQHHPFRRLIDGEDTTKANTSTLKSTQSQGQATTPEVSETVQAQNAFVTTQPSQEHPRDQAWTSSPSQTLRTSVLPPLPISSNEPLLFPARGPVEDYLTTRKRENLSANEGDTSSLADPTYGVEASSVFPALHTSQLQKKASGISADASSNQISPKLESLDLNAKYTTGAMYEDGPITAFGNISGPSGSMDADVKSPLSKVSLKDSRIKSHSHKVRASNSERLVQNAVDGQVALFAEPILLSRLAFYKQM